MDETLIDKDNTDTANLHYGKSTNMVKSKAKKYNLKYFLPKPKQGKKSPSLPYLHGVYPLALASV